MDDLIVIAWTEQQQQQQQNQQGGRKKKTRKKRGGTDNLCKVYQEQRDWEESKKTVTNGEANQYCKRFGDKYIQPNTRNLCSINTGNCWLGPNSSEVAPRRRLVRTRNRTVAIDDQGFSSTQGGSKKAVSYKHLTLPTNREV